MTTTPGPYWIAQSLSGRIRICGRHGKTVAHYGADQEAEAVAHLRQLQPIAAPPAVRRPLAPSKRAMAEQIFEATRGRAPSGPADTAVVDGIVSANTRSAMAATLERLRRRST